VLEFITQPGDVFLLCSDGLYQGLSHGELGSALSVGPPRQVVDRLFSDVLRGAAQDDLTAVVVQP
jgi:serine/threonine-protein phosphatase Stp1